MNEIMSLTPDQMMMMQEGLNQVLMDEHGNEGKIEEAKNKVPVKTTSVVDQALSEKIKRMKKKGMTKVDPFKLFGSLNNA